MPDGGDAVLDVRGLKTVFRTRGGEVHAVNAVSFHLKRGELLGVVGESGSGKSVTMMSLIGLLPTPPAEVRAGEVWMGAACANARKRHTEGIQRLLHALVCVLFDALDHRVHSSWACAISVP